MFLWNKSWWHIYVTSQSKIMLYIELAQDFILFSPTFPSGANVSTTNEIQNPDVKFSFRRQQPWLCCQNLHSVQFEWKQTIYCLIIMRILVGVKMTSAFSVRIKPQTAFLLAAWVTEHNIHLHIKHWWLEKSANASQMNNMFALCVFFNFTLRNNFLCTCLHNECLPFASFYSHNTNCVQR